MARLSVRLLGPMQVTLDGQPVTRFETEKARALLAYLAAEADQPHRRDFLAEMLWPERLPGAANANLRHALACLRRAIGDPADGAITLGAGGSVDVVDLDWAQVDLEYDLYQNLHFRLTDFDLRSNRIQATTGLALLPEPAVAPEVKSRTLAMVQIADEAAVRPLGIIHRQGRVFSPAAQQFLECLRAQ